MLQTSERYLAGGAPSAGGGGGGGSLPTPTKTLLYTISGRSDTFAYNGQEYYTISNPTQVIIEFITSSISIY